MRGRCAWLVLLTGCCPEGALQPGGDLSPLSPGASVSLTFVWDDEAVAGPEDCGGSWYVEEILGGSEAVGTVTTCGLYTAPASFENAALADGAAAVLAATDPLGSCADCCPHASLDVPLALP